MTLQERSLFSRALNKWGFNSQREMAEEEMIELMLNLKRLRRGRLARIEDLAEEIADVSIMLDQIKVNYGSEFEKLIGTIRARKILRLELRVNDPSHPGN